MIPHRDEILRPAVSTDATAVPRYNLVRPDGTIIEENVALRLSNPVAREGTPISKAALDEMLAASGVTAGTATAYTLAQEEYTLFDGAPVRFRLHVASGDGATLNINGTGAKPLRDMMGAAMPGGIPAGTWLTACYSAAAGAYVLAGGEAVRALYGERYTVDDAVAHVKDVPTDALPVAEIGEIGGMTYKVNVGTEANPVYELRSAPVTEMESVGVNLIPYPYYETTKSEHGITFTDNGDGSLTIDGTATELINYYMQLNNVVRLEPNTKYYFNYGYIQYGLRMVIHYTSAEQGSFETDASGFLNYCVIQIDSGATFDNVTVYPMIYKGTAALPYTPYFRETLPIPEAVQAIDGYGWGINADCYNYIYWEKKRFVKRVGCVDMGTLDWGYTAPEAIFWAPVRHLASQKKTLCELYSNPTTYVEFQKGDKMIIAYHTFAINAINIKDSAYTDAATFKTAMSGVMLYYELAEPIITDISAILPADNLLRVQPGGTITPINEYNYAVPTTITYQRDVLANRASTFALEKLWLAMELLASIDEVTPAVSAAIAAAVAPLAKAEAITTAIDAHKAESAAHNAASIVTDTSRQFVTAAEKAAWNAGGGSAKILSNTRITSDSNSITINLPTDYNYFRIILSEVATTDTTLGTVRGSLNASSMDSSGMQLGADDSDGAAFVVSTESTSYLFTMMLADDKTFGAVSIDIARHSGTIQGTCSWVVDGNGSDANVGMAMHTFSASDDATTMTISTLGGYYLRHGMGILVLGAK